MVENVFITEVGFYWVKDMHGDWTIVEAERNSGDYLLLYFLGSDESESAEEVLFTEIRRIEDPDTEDDNQKAENEHCDADK